MMSPISKKDFFDEDLGSREKICIENNVNKNQTHFYFNPFLFFKKRIIIWRLPGLCIQIRSIGKIQ